MKKLRVPDVLAAMENGDEEVFQSGGRIHKSSPSRSKEEKPSRPSKKRGTERPQDKRTLPEKLLGETEKEVSAPLVQKPVTVLVEKNEAVKPPKEEGVIVMEGKTSATTAKAVNTNTRHEFYPCPICGHGKSDEKFLVCKACNDRYAAVNKKAADEFFAGNKAIVVPGKIDWVLSQINIPLFEKELAEMRMKREPQRSHGILKVASQKANADARVYHQANGKFMPTEMFQSLVENYRKQELDNINFQMRRLNARLRAANALKLQLEKKPAEVKPATEPVAPAEAATPVLAEAGSPSA